MRRAAHAAFVLHCAPAAATHPLFRCVLIITLVCVCVRLLLSIDSGAMETKAHALQMLHQYLSAMRTQAMLPFIDSVAEVVTGHIRFGYHEEIRHASLCSLHSILRIALEDAANPGHAQKLLAPMLEPLVTSVQHHPLPQAHPPAPDTLLTICCLYVTGAT